MVEEKMNIISSLIWKILENGAVQIVQFFVQIILARILLPDDYGFISLVAIFIAIANVLIQSGFNAGLIQRLDIDEIDFSTVFYFCLFISFLLYVLLFFITPTISAYFEESKLTPIVRILGLMLPFSAFNSIQQALISRKMLFKKLFFASLISAVFSGTISVFLALLKYGVWSLVTQQLIYQISIVTILCFTIKWKPTLVFSIKRLKMLLTFGWKILLSDFIDRLYMNCRSLVIAKLYSPMTLGFYNKGKEFPSLLVTNVNGSIQAIMFPILSQQQKNKKMMKIMVRRAIVTSSFVVFPMMVGLAVIADPLVRITLTEKWLPAIPFLQIYCISYSLWPINTANLQAINALGRSDISLRLEILKKAIGLIILLVTVSYGVDAIALGALLSGFCSTLINMKPNKELLDYSYYEQCIDILPSLILSLAMGTIVSIVYIFTFSSLLTLFLQIIVGAIFYLSMAYVFKLNCLVYLISTMQLYLGNKSNGLLDEDVTNGKIHKVLTSKI